MQIKTIGDRSWQGAVARQAAGLMPAQYVRPFVKINKHDQADPRVRLCRPEGKQAIGALIATALIAAIDGGQACARGRGFACWLALVPRQHATRGKARLLGISQRGNGYLRRLLVHAPRALKRSAKTRVDHLGIRVRGLEARAHPDVATVALAAKLAR